MGHVFFRLDPLSSTVSIWVRGMFPGRYDQLWISVAAVCVFFIWSVIGGGGGGCRSVGARESSESGEVAFLLARGMMRGLKLP